MLLFGMAQTAQSRIPDIPPERKAATAASTSEVVRYIDLKLAALGHAAGRPTDTDFLELARPLLRNYHQKDLMLGEHLCPADQRIQAFLDDYLKLECPRGTARMPNRSFVLDRPGLARVMSLPHGGEHFSSPYLQSYRVPQGILQQS